MTDAKADSLHTVGLVMLVAVVLLPPRECILALALALVVRVLWRVSRFKVQPSARPGFTRKEA
jgi:uncharacterized membrane protein